MRKKFVFYIVLPAFLLLVTLHFFLDSWVEAGLELGGQSLVGARVEIDDLKLSLSPIGLEFSRLQVADPGDPWTNTIETGKTKFAVDFGQLLRGKYIIEAMEVNDLILGTKRSTDGSLSDKREPKKPMPSSATEQQAAGETVGPAASLSGQAKTVSEQKKTSTPLFDMDRLRKQLNIDSLLNTRNLQSLRHIDSLKVQIHQAGQQWQSAIRDLEQSKQRVAQIEKSIKAINVGELKSIQSIADALKNANEASKGIKEVSETFQTRRGALTEEVNRLTSSIRLVDDLVKEDYRSLLELARLPDISMRGIADLLLGKEVFAKAGEYLAWIDFAQKNIQNVSPDPEIESPPRLKGQDIHFPKKEAFPKFWIKKILVSGGTDAAQDPNYFYAQGEIKNVTSDQRATGVPITVALTAKRGRGTSATLDASFDRTGDMPVDHYKASLSGVPLAPMDLGRSDFLPSKITKATTSYAVEVTVPGKKFDANARVRFSNVVIAFDQPPRGIVERIVHDVLASVGQFAILLRFWKIDGALDAALETDLDNLIAERMKRVVGEEINRLRNELRAKLDQKVLAKKKELEALFNQKKEEITGQLKGYEQLVNEKVTLADGKKKELEDKIEAEKKKQAGKAGDALKGIFKKK